MSASALIKKKVADAPKDTASISLATAGKDNGQAPFQDRNFPDLEMENMMTVT